MTSPLIPYGRQTVTAGDIAAVESVLRGPFLTQGPAVPSFEHALSTTVSAQYAVATNSATSALHLGCLALGMNEGGCLWTSPITFVASANCARYCGSQVDFVDIDPTTGLMSLEALERKLLHASSHGELPNLIVPVHLAGTSCAMKEIADLVSPFGIPILEDASHAVGARYEEQPVGSCLYSDASVFSFHPVKIITTGEGGALTTNNQDIASRVALLRSHGIVKDVEQFEFKPSGPWSYEQQELGFNYRLTDLQAALGQSQLNRLHEVVAERHRLWLRYQSLFEGMPISLLNIPNNCRSSLHLAVILLDDDDSNHHRHVFEGLRASGIGVQLHYSPVHLQPYYRRLGFHPGDYPNAESYARSAISLPLYPGLTELDQDRVLLALKEYL